MRVASTPSVPTASAIKRVGRNGQISIGKQFAGREVLLEEAGPGVWTVRLGRFVPDSERWLHEEPASSSITRAVSWAEQTPAAETTLASLTRRRPVRRVR